MNEAEAVESLGQSDDRKKAGRHENGLHPLPSDIVEGALATFAQKGEGVSRRSYRLAVAPVMVLIARKRK